jgi:hypothetical protein
MPLITLNFSPEMEELMMQGKKICTTRLEQKGEIGDCFVVQDRLYRIVGLESEELAWMSAYHLLEGFESPEDYLNKIFEFYPDITEMDPVVLHWIAYVCDVCQDFNLGCNSCIPSYCQASEVCNHG